MSECPNKPGQCFCNPGQMRPECLADKFQLDRPANIPFAHVYPDPQKPCSECDSLKARVAELEGVVGQATTRTKEIIEQLEGGFLACQCGRQADTKDMDIMLIDLPDLLAVLEGREPEHATLAGSPSDEGQENCG